MHSSSYWRRERNVLTPSLSTTMSTCPDGVYLSSIGKSRTVSTAFGHSFDTRSTMCVIWAADNWLKFCANSRLFSTDGILLWMNRKKPTSHSQELYIITIAITHADLPTDGTCSRKGPEVSGHICGPPSLQDCKEDNCSKSAACLQRMRRHRHTPYFPILSMW